MVTGKRVYGFIGFIFSVAVLVSVQSNQAYAGFWESNHHRNGYHREHHQNYRWNHGYNHHRDYPYGRVSINLPHGYLSINLGRSHYYYSDGLFYSRKATNYVVVPAPEGVVIVQPPRGYNKVIVDGVEYYSYNGVYYRQVDNGYRVVVPPEPVIVDTAVVEHNPGIQRIQEEFTVNIPNAKGGYSSVNIKRSGNGFVGPQGEFYNEFPKIEQLKLMYGK